MNILAPTAATIPTASRATGLRCDAALQELMIFKNGQEIDSCSTWKPKTYGMAQQFTSNSSFERRTVQEVAIRWDRPCKHDGAAG